MICIGEPSVDNYTKILDVRSRLNYTFSDFNGAVFENFTAAYQNSFCLLLLSKLAALSQFVTISTTWLHSTSICGMVFATHTIAILSAKSIISAFAGRRV